MSTKLEEAIKLGFQVKRRFTLAQRLESKLWPMVNGELTPDERRTFYQRLGFHEGTPW